MEVNCFSIQPSPRESLEISIKALHLFLPDVLTENPASPEAGFTFYLHKKSYLIAL